MSDIAMQCQKCESYNVASINCDFTNYGSIYIPKFVVEFSKVPCGMNTGNDDYLDLKFCLDCGQVQGEFPVNMETVAEENELEVDETYEDPEKRQERIDALDSICKQQDCECEEDCGQNCNCSEVLGQGNEEDC